MKLDILMFRHLAQGQVVQSFHQSDHGIIVLRKRRTELNMIITHLTTFNTLYQSI